jgi:phosphoribosylanthranilate isomerase
MHRTRIKICGVCRPEDAAHAAAAGADAIGMIFHPPSPRNIWPQRAREIIAQLPPFVTPVGLFVDASTDTILGTARDVGLRHVQLNGDETPEQVRALAPLAVIKAVRVERESLVEVLSVWRTTIHSFDTRLAGLVLETAGTGRPGGTGVANDWDAISDAQRAGLFNGLPPVVAAGGLRPETVGDVVRKIRPFAVDVSSGVESTRGCKSEEKVREFARAVRAADALE